MPSKRACLSVVQLRCYHVATVVRSIPLGWYRAVVVEMRDRSDQVLLRPEAPMSLHLPHQQVLLAAESVPSANAATLHTAML